MLAVSTPGSGLGGILLSETPVPEPWVKDHDATGAVVAYGSPDLHLLEGREDLAAVWDLRVSPDLRSAGVGAALFAAAERWVRARGGRRLEVETQQVNVVACRFYAAMGCELVAIDRGVYPELPEEVQLIWSKALEC